MAPFGSVKLLDRFRSLRVQEVDEKSFSKVITVDDLPPEILGTIFRLCVQEHEDGFDVDWSQRSWTITSLSLVSKSWRGLVVGDAVLWSKLDLLRMPSDVVEMYLARSAGAPLTFLWRDRDGTFVPADPTQQERIAESLARVERLEIALEPRDIPSWLLNDSAPQLKALRLQFNDIRDPVFLPCLFREGAPKLHILEAHGCKLPWSQFANLTKFSLTTGDTGFTDVADGHDLLSPIQASPNLESLSLTILASDESSDKQQLAISPSEPVILTDLRALNLTMPSHLFRLLFSTIRLPDRLDHLQLQTVYSPRSVAVDTNFAPLIEDEHIPSTLFDNLRSLKIGIIKTWESGSSVNIEGCGVHPSGREYNLVFRFLDNSPWDGSQVKVFLDAVTDASQLEHLDTLEVCSNEMIAWSGSGLPPAYTVTLCELIHGATSLRKLRLQSGQVFKYLFGEQTRLGSDECAQLSDFSLFDSCKAPMEAFRNLKAFLSSPVRNLADSNIEVQMEDTHDAFGQMQVHRELQEIGMPCVEDGHGMRYRFVGPQVGKRAKVRRRPSLASLIPSRKGSQTSF